MRYSSTLAVVAAVAPLAHAHGGGAPLPKIVGLNPRDVKARNVLSDLGARFVDVRNRESRVPKRALKPRQGDQQCGAGFGSCPKGVCCSQAGYCGNGPDYCYAPGCNYQYGPGCPDNVTPAGASTSSIPRTKVGSVPYGGDGVYSCTEPGVIALTYDDGPAATYTAHILDLFKSYNAKATFFISGNNINKGEIDTTAEFVSDIKRMDAEGHQIASHTWTHLDLSAISQADRKAQMYKNEMALRNIVGKIPTYMRPPYSSCTGQCETDMAALGYHVIYFDVDTDDYNQDSPNLIQKSKNWFTGNITANGATAAGGAMWLDIQHDIHEQTANNLTEYMLKTIKNLGYKSVTVGECLGDPKANWYRTAGGATGATSTTKSATPSPSVSTSPSASTSAKAKTVSTDGTCGGTKGTTCLNSGYGNCCSPAGWCGSTTDYCATGCQTGFGNCGSNNAATSAAPKTSAPAAKSSTPAAASPTPKAKVTTDGTCGGTGAATCPGSTYGNCCSQYGWCGSDAAHCGTGCNKAFGTCT